jgi:hypothetical protein
MRVQKGGQQSCRVHWIHVATISFSRVLLLNSSMFFVGKPTSFSCTHFCLKTFPSLWPHSRWPVITSLQVPRQYTITRVHMRVMSRIGAAIPPGSRGFCHLRNVQTRSAAHQTVPRFFPQKVKRPKLEADNSTFNSAEAKNECSYTSTPPYALMAWQVKSFRFVIS